MKKETERWIKRRIQKVAKELQVRRKDKKAALRLFERIKNSKIEIGRKRDIAPVALVYIACRQNRRPRELIEMQRIANVRIKRIKNTIEEITKELGIKLLPVNLDYAIDRHCYCLKESNAVRIKAKEIIKKAQTIGIIKIIPDRKIQGIIASAIYVAAILCGEHKSQKEIGETMDVSEVTISHEYRKIADGLDIDIFI